MKKTGRRRGAEKAKFKRRRLEAVGAMRQVRRRKQKLRLKSRG